MISLVRFPDRPDGAAASGHLGQQSAVRINAARRERPPLSEAEKEAARRQRAVGRELGDFVSAPPDYAAGEIRAQQV